MIVGPDRRVHALRMSMVTDAMLTGLIDRVESQDEIIADLQQQLVGKDLTIEQLTATLRLVTGWMSALTAVKDGKR